MSIATNQNRCFSGIEISRWKSKSHMECHIEDDFLLIWIDDDIVELVRLGSHSELFK